MSASELPSPDHSGEVRPESPVCTVDGRGARRWCLPDGSLHRADGPAVIQSDGTQEWWQHGERHRDGGPAVTRPDGYEVWFQHGRQHRKDGPAVVYGRFAQWWLNGVEVEPTRLDEVSWLLGGSPGTQARLSGVGV